MSNYRPHERTARRLAQWKRLASTGTARADIATSLGMTLVALDQAICRARRRGHPDAIHHLLAALPGTGTSHLTDSTVRARRRAQETR